jgi:Prokaryotic dksA/traR C4-type zinc finger
MNCRTCNDSIESERLEVLPNTVFCSACAHKHNVVKPRKAFTVHSHKTGSEIQIVSADYFEQNKRYFIPDGARSALKNFSKSICA